LNWIDRSSSKERESDLISSIQKSPILNFGVFFVGGPGGGDFVRNNKTKDI